MITITPKFHPPPALRWIAEQYTEGEHVYHHDTGTDVYLDALSDDHRAIVDHAADLITAELRNVYRLSLRTETVVLSVLRAGESRGAHADAERYEDGRWVPNHTPDRSHVGLLYLSDPDAYQGGELVVHPSVTIKAAAGMLVTLPATHEYVHEVRTVQQGSRATLSVWVTQ